MMPTSTALPALSMVARLPASSATAYTINLRRACARPFRLSLMLTAAIFLLPTLSSASIIGLTGAVVESTPSSLISGADESSSVVRIFEERTQFLGNFYPDAIGPDTELGICTARDGLGLCTDVDPTHAASLITNIYNSGIHWSYFIHFDPLTGPTPTRLSGRVTFERRIYGLLLTNSSLDASDLVYGHTLSYPTGTPLYRGVEVSGPEGGNHDYLRIIGLNTLEFSLQAGGSGTGIDQLRVITAGDPVPEPATAFLVLAGLVGLAHRQRRRS